MKSGDGDHHEFSQKEEKEAQGKPEKAIPVVGAKDSIRVETEEGNVPLDRNIIRLVQTPQTFHSQILLPAYKIDYKEQFTDEATVVEAFGLTVTLVEGEENNIKITRAEDLEVAARLMGF